MPPIIHIQATPSTNSYLRQLLSEEKLEEGTIVITNHQTAGRGQRGNTWESEKGKNLTFSMVLHPSFIPIHEQFILSQIVSLAIKTVLDEYKMGITIKWPNDIYWQEKKICGILIENALSEDRIENCIIGIGLNINQKQFNSDAPNPISLTHITKKNQELEPILIAIQNHILSYYQKIKEGNRISIIEEYKQSLFRKEGFHLYSDGERTFEAQIIDIELSGHLILRTKDKKDLKFAFKEVKYILK